MTAVCFRHRRTGRCRLRCYDNRSRGRQLWHPERARREGEEVELLEGVSTQDQVDRSRRINADCDKYCVLKIIAGQKMYPYIKQEHATVAGAV
jgi:hypothetical protein